MLEEGFVPFPKTLLRTLSSVLDGATLDHVATILAIIDYKRGGDDSRLPTLELLAFTAGMAESKFMRQLAALQSMCILNVSGPPEALLIETQNLERRILEECQKNP